MDLNKEWENFYIPSIKNGFHQPIVKVNDRNDVKGNDRNDVKGNERNDVKGNDRNNVKGNDRNDVKGNERNDRNETKKNLPENKGKEVEATNVALRLSPPALSKKRKSEIQNQDQNITQKHGLSFSVSTANKKKKIHVDFEDEINRSNGFEEKNKNETSLHFLQLPQPQLQPMSMPLSPPQATEIYVSTMTKVAQISFEPFDLPHLFWHIAVLPYGTPANGVVKKQIKIVSSSKEELDQMQAKLPSKDDHTQFVKEHIITSIHVPLGRNSPRFKDVRKISIGIDQKDVLYRRTKEKKVFYNCIVLMLRMWREKDAEFKEYHVKVFNTGKIGVPGIQDDATFLQILQQLILLLQPFCRHRLAYRENTLQTSLINSNFNCGYYINREVLFQLLVKKYNIEASYEPCTYPGIQCTFYYDPLSATQPGYILPPRQNNRLRINKKQQKKPCSSVSSLNLCSHAEMEENVFKTAERKAEKYMEERKDNSTISNKEKDNEKDKDKDKEKETNKDNDNEAENEIKEVSFMIFRTGSVLISGKQHKTNGDDILMIVYQFLKKLFEEEYVCIRQKKVKKEMKKECKQKLRNMFVASYPCLPSKDIF